MQRRILGTTGVSVSSLCLGTLNFGSFGNSDHEDSIRIIREAIDSGINIIDTADEYSLGESEEIVGKALRQLDRSQLILATKVYSRMGSDPNQRGGSRRWIIQEVEASLRRLDTDYIDLYQLHRPDEWTDLDDSLGALTDLIQAGKVRYAGTSTFQPHEMVEAQWIAERRSRERPRTEQPPYSILVRGIETATLPVAEKYGMGVLVWSPLAGGWLSGAYGPGKENSVKANRPAVSFDPSLPANQDKIEAVGKLQALADEAGLSLIHLALGFVLAHPAVTTAVIGPRTMSHLRSQVAAGDIRLGVDVLDRIDEIVAPGTNLNSADAGWTPRVLTDASRRRSRLDVPGSPIATRKGPTT